jgi:hypothetical protein
LDCEVLISDRRSVDLTSHADVEAWMALSRPQAVLRRGLRAWRNSRSRETSMAWLSPDDILVVEPPNTRPDLGTVVILSTIKRLAKCRPRWAL